MSMTREENELITKTGPGTALGEVMRRYWIPAALAVGAAGAGLPADSSQASQ